MGFGEPVVDGPIRKNPVGGKLRAQREGMKHQIPIHGGHIVESPDVDAIPPIAADTS